MRSISIHTLYSLHTKKHYISQCFVLLILGNYSLFFYVTLSITIIRVINEVHCLEIHLKTKVSAQSIKNKRWILHSIILISCRVERMNIDIYIEASLIQEGEDHSSFRGVIKIGKRVINKAGLILISHV